MQDIVARALAVVPADEPFFPQPPPDEQISVPIVKT
jgi:hypothetical protein